MLRATSSYTVVPVTVPTVKSRLTKKLVKTVTATDISELASDDEQARAYAIKSLTRKLLWCWISFVFVFILGSFCVLGVQAAGLREMQIVRNRSDYELSSQQEKNYALCDEVARAKSACLNNSKLENMIYPSADRVRVIANK